MSGMTQPSAIQRSFVSSQQTITAAGSLTIAHGLGAIPTFITVDLICQSAEGNYAVNDVVSLLGQPIQSASDPEGVSIVPNATNLNIRFGSHTGAFQLVNKTTGATFTITNANWKAIFKAFI